MSFDQSTDPTLLSNLEPYSGLGLFDTIGATPGNKNLLNANLRAIADRLTTAEAARVWVDREVAVSDDQEIADDIITSTATLTVTLIPTADSVKPIRFFAETGTLTIDGFEAELIGASSTLVLTVGNTVTLVVVSPGFWAVVD